MKVEIDPENVKKKSTDSRGRFTLGSEFAGKTVEVAVLDVHGSEDDE